MSVQHEWSLMNILFLYNTQTNSDWFYFSRLGLLRFTWRTKKGDYDVSMLMFCCEYFSSVITLVTPQPHASKLLVARCTDWVWFFTMACNDKLNLKHDGKIKIGLIRAKRHLCNYGQLLVDLDSNLVDNSLPTIDWLPALIICYDPNSLPRLLYIHEPTGIPVTRASSGPSLSISTAWGNCSHGGTLPLATHDKSRVVPPIRQITPKKQKNPKN